MTRLEHDSIDMIKKENIKIAFITHYTELYGANRSLLDLIDGLVDHGNVKIVLISPQRGKITEEVERRDIEYLIIPFYNEIRQGKSSGLLTNINNIIKGLIKFLFNWYLVFKYSSKLKHFDIIHTNSSVTFMGAYFSKWLGKIHIWHLREFGWEDYKIIYNFGIKYFGFWLNNASAAIAISQAIFEKRLAGVRVKRKEVIYNGIFFLKDLKLNSRNLVSTAKENNLVFIIVGVIAKGKKQMEAIKAFHLLHEAFQDCKLLIVGSGDVVYENELKNYVQENHLNNCISFLGFVNPVIDIYKNADCLLMCSENEALGRVTIEALSQGVPVIGYNNAGTQEIIQDMFNGLLYKNGFLELYQKMTLIIVDNLLREKLRTNAIQSVKRFTIEDYSYRIYTLYKALMN